MWECEYSDWLSVLPSTSATVTVEPVLPGADCGACEPPRWMQVVADDGDSTAGSSSSSSLRRAPGRAEDFVRGSVTNTPFTPGGETTLTAAAAASAKEALHQAARTEWLPELEAGRYHGVPPGFATGLWTRPCVAPPAPAPAPVANEDGAKKAPLKAMTFEELFKSAWESEATLDDEEEDDEDEPDSDEEAMDQQQTPSASEGAVQGGSHGERTAGHVTSGEAGVGIPEQRQQVDAEVEALLHGIASREEWEKSILAAARSGVKRAGDGVVLRGAQVGKRKEEKWAVMERMPNINQDFSALVPQPAREYAFELDVFQKEAIYHMEQGDSVFVAAHTSAGKTVVAEYAFALATKHCTKAIYTSPIKTISNQKFRDFSDQFEVGLLTGDVQVRAESPCLIMTTEILRSMLYKGADLIRDIEWVVFDEVHYINDVERGVVWEEVIIMLPEHIKIVMLSATVPNVFDFADWVGRTKRKHIYVTGTMRRPVPLEHHVYYNHAFYKVCEQTTMHTQGIKDALAAQRSKNAPPSVKPGVHKPGGGRGAPGRGGGGGGGGGGRGGGAGGKNNHHGGRGGGGGGANSGVADRNQWLTLVNKLGGAGLLPVVVFCFSKKRCDACVDGLTTLDLTSNAEKAEIHMFCERALARLNPGDRKLPQVLRVRELCKRGLGVHHAGLLPIVKEVVEMLFCQGLLKVLFSTETFAMGVNAPARTVVFQSTRKHDGNSFRTLLSGEYTQMAGRAGRRGLDTVGTVVIMCPDNVPEESELRTLILGKATMLESRFRLRYNMIVNLLRVEDLSVEDMLKRSFMELRAQRALKDQTHLLSQGEQTLERINALAEAQAGRPCGCPCGCTFGDAQLEDYYDYAHSVEQLTEQLHGVVMASGNAKSAMVAGRTILLKGMHGVAEPALVLRAVSTAARPAFSRLSTTDESTKGQYYVLALHRGAADTRTDAGAAEQTGRRQQQRAELEGMQVLAGRRHDDHLGFGGLGDRRGVEVDGPPAVPLPYFGSSGEVSYSLLQVAGAQVLSICKTKLRVDAAAVLERLEPRAVAQAVQQLHSLVHEEANGLVAMSIQELKLQDMDAVDAYQRREESLAQMALFRCHRCPKLPEQYALIRNRRMLTERIRHLQYQVSDASVQQMPEYLQRVRVLQQTGFIDEDKVVQMKGRIMCELNACDELVGSEMIFAGVLAELEPEEAVALLSALVFQEKTDDSPALPEKLVAAKARMLQLAKDAADVQLQCGLDVVAEDYCKAALNFGLVQVVYEWARGTPFADICMLTDVPEGSIVRCIVRLDEVCREVKDAARLMGDSTLFLKMQTGSELIKRDIVFSASLYIAKS